MKIYALLSRKVEGFKRALREEEEVRVKVKDMVYYWARGEGDFWVFYGLGLIHEFFLCLESGLMKLYGLNRSCDFFQFFSVKQCSLDQILRIELNFLNIEPIKVNFAILNSPLHCWLLNTFSIRTDKFPKWFLILVLEYFECFRKRQKIICFFCTLCNFYSDCIFNFLQKWWEVFQRVLTLLLEYFTIVTLFDGLIDFKNILDIIVMNFLSCKIFQFGVKILISMHRQQKQQMNCNYWFLVLGFWQIQSVFIEKSDTFNGNFELSIVTR